MENLSKKNVVWVCGYEAIKSSSSIEIASEEITVMKNSEFCENMSKSKTANRVTLIIYLCTKVTKMSHFSEFLSWIMQNIRNGWTRDQNIDSCEEISFLG